MRDYFDHNATSPLRKEAREALEAALASGAANASSLHAEGRAARALVEEARESVAELAGVAPRDVVFTSGGSEAIAAAIHGITARGPDPRHRILVSAVEHSSVLDAVRFLAWRGFEIREVRPGPTGRIDPAEFMACIDTRTALACLQAANNETGVVQQLEDVGRACAAAAVPFLVDAVQALGKIPIERDAWRADLMALSSHKIGGPQGAGALIVREGMRMTPLIHGGAQERRRRGGTEPVAALAAFGAAARAAGRDRAAESARLGALRDRMEAALRAMAPGVRIQGEGVPRLPHMVHAAFPGVTGETLAIALDLAGFSISTGSACASGAVVPSHVLRAMGWSEGDALRGVRISMGWSTSAESVDRLLDALPSILARATMSGR